MEMLKNANYSLILVAAIAAKAIILDVSVAAMLVTVPLLSFEAYKIFIKHKTPDPVKITEEMQRELDGIKSKLNLITVDKALKPRQPERWF